MEKRRRIEAISGETDQFPEEIIQHIQSFLSGKEAARTTILSKSWYNSWLTRPNLDFDAWDIPKPTGFVEFVNKTLQRYEELNRKILRFKLLGRSCYHYITWGGISVAMEWTKKAMKLGATDLHIQVSPFFVLPREVLESDSLVRLSMHCGRMDKVSCLRLKYLNLHQVRLLDDNYNDNTIWDIIWMCPLIEEFLLSAFCTGSYDLKPGLDAKKIHKLKVLSLEMVKIGEWLFRDLSFKFPCLKELTLKYCTGYKKVQICSDSLERIVLLDDDNNSMMSRVEFDVPRIRRFELMSFFVPSLSFETTSRECESHIRVSSNKVNSSWFVELRKFLQELSSSKIYLKLLIIPDKAYECASHMSGLPKSPIVERLDLNLRAPTSVQSALLEEFFWSCRPNFIRLPLHGKKYDVIKLICNTLTKEECGMYDLEKVNVEISGHIAWTWSRNLRASKFAYLEWIDDHTDVCLQLKWG